MDRPLPCPLYLVTYDYRDRIVGRSTGTADRSLNKQSRREVTDEIVQGLIPGVERIYECVPGESCTDITEDIAGDVACRIVNEQRERDYDTVTWLHAVLGTTSMAWPVAAE